jgi:hypothetical protein
MEPNGTANIGTRWSDDDRPLRRMLMMTDDAPPPPFVYDGLHPALEEKT